MTSLPREERLLTPVPALGIPALTHQIQTAIDRMSSQGGGQVTLGPGIWEITTIRLRTGVTLHLELGAILQAATDIALYPVIEGSADNKDQSKFHLIHAEGCEDIALTGPGIIDGQDTAFWAPCESEAQRPYGIFDYYVPGERLSPLVQIVRCRRVRVEGVTIRRSPSWTLHLYDCDDVQVRQIRMRNHLLGPNTDGIGINSCRDVIISGCDITGGDDSIIVKATLPGKPCERVIVSNCIADTNCTAFGIGSETQGGIRDISFTNCVSRRSLRIVKIQLWSTGWVENVIFSNIVGRTYPTENVTCERPIYIDIQEFKKPGQPLGRVRNVQFSNIVCTTRGRILITAQDGATVENITLRDIHLDIPEIEDPAEAVPKARSMQLSNFSPQARVARAAAVFDNVRDLRVQGLTLRWPEPASVPMHALWFRNVRAVIDAPFLTASQPGVETRVLQDSEVSFRA